MLLRSSLLGLALLLVQDLETLIRERSKVPGEGRAGSAAIGKRDGPFFDEEHLGVLKSVFTFLDGGRAATPLCLQRVNSLPHVTPMTCAHLWCVWGEGEGRGGEWRLVC